jgi:hypothetical protein
MLRRVLLIGLALIGSPAAPALAHPGGHGAEEATPSVWDETVRDPATAWLRLKEHRDTLAKSVASEDWEAAATLGAQLSPVAGDLVRVSSGLPPEALATLRSGVRDLSVTGRQLGYAARAGRGKRVADLLSRVDLYMRTIAEKYPEGILEP